MRYAAGCREAGVWRARRAAAVGCGGACWPSAWVPVANGLWDAEFGWYLTEAEGLPQYQKRYFWVVVNDCLPWICTRVIDCDGAVRCWRPWSDACEPRINATRLAKMRPTSSWHIMIIYYDDHTLRGPCAQPWPRWQGSC